MKKWRLITDDDVSASFGLAADEAITQRVGSGESPPTLRLYTYRSYCALVGRFQNIRNEIRVDFCFENDVQINRRPTGGGAIIMGQEQLGVALMIPNSLSLIPSWEGRGWVKNPIDINSAQANGGMGSTRELMRCFSTGLISALDAFGIQATFQRKNDLEVDGRKIAGLGLYRDPGGGLLFHASLLVDLDVSLMLQILQTPFEKISDKEIRTVANRISTVREETSAAISLNEVREKVAKSYADGFGVDLEAGGFLQEEKQVISRFERRKYLDQNWIYQSSEVTDHVGFAKRKTSGGLLDVRLALAGHMLKAVYIGGDFFASEKAIADLEACLRWHSSEPDKVARTVQKVYRKREGEFEMLPETELVQTILEAVDNAMGEAAKTPYGCFVTPGGEHV